MWGGALGLKGTSAVAGEGQRRALALSLSLRVPGRNSSAEAGGHSLVQVLAAVATQAPFPATACSPLLQHPFLRGVLPEGPVGQGALGRAPQAPAVPFSEPTGRLPSTGHWPPGTHPAQT